MLRRRTTIAGCVLAIAALALAAVPAGADRQDVAPAGAAVPVVQQAAALNPPPGMLRAIARDLNLSISDARARLISEARLSPVAMQLTAQLGPRFGGAWFRPQNARVLMVATTSAADIPMIVAAGAQAEVVEKSFAELTAIKAKLDITLPQVPGVSNVRYVDAKRNKVVVLTLEPIRAELRVLSTDVDHSSVLVMPSAEAPLPLYDLVGGTPYYIGTSSRCSVGFSVRKGTQEGFASAGHCGRTGSATTGFNRVAQGVFQGSSFPGNDYSWVATNANWRVTPTVDNGRGSTVPVAGATPAIEGASVCRSGSTTDWHCGLIQQREASITYPQGTVTQLVRTSVCAEPGDSGGSFISLDQAQGVTSGGSGDCSQGGTTYFQPIGEILSAYGLTLVTTGGGTTPPPGTNPCTGFPNNYSGTLAAGQSSYQPGNAYYLTYNPGVHSGCVNGPAGSDFDLYLQKWDNRSAWVTVATSDGPGPSATISYTGTAGYYRYRVTATGGSGPYTLGIRVP
ncbi:S1 family peptidase [Streptosporangium sp. NPDC002721]|uniref:S1 family peptidase n=1 Tax=Streptosporangium sp. NPDC002721 TaxID=3366188 RepID=UPI0036B724D0